MFLKKFTINKLEELKRKVFKDTNKQNYIHRLFQTKSTTTN
jgi:hypothetical protein